MPEGEALLARAIELVQAGAPAFEPTVSRETAWDRIDLPYPSGADYRFQVWVYPDSEPQITAHLVDAPEQDFWSYSFELADFDSPQHQAEFFLQEFKRLLRAATSIEDRQGFVWRSFLGFLEGTAREPFGGRSLLAPSSRRHRRLYQSPPLLSD